MALWACFAELMIPLLRDLRGFMGMVRSSLLVGQRERTICAADGNTEVHDA